MAKKKKNGAEEQQPEEILSETEEVTSEQQEEVDEAAQKLSEAEKKVEEAEKKLADINDTLLRLRADFDNYRKRNAQIRTDSISDGKALVIAEILKPLDNFERALATDCSDEGFKSGMEMIYKMIASSLQSLGVEEIDASGAFDPNVHEAVMQEESEDVKSGDIIAVLQKGYKLNGKVIRPAMVKVAK